MDARTPSVETPRCPGCRERDRRIAPLEASTAAPEARVAELGRIIDGLRRTAPAPSLVPAASG